MPLNFQHKTLKQYSDLLAGRQSVPGGGSAAALTAALGAGLISMVTQYSLGRKANTKTIETHLKNSLRKSEQIRKRLLVLVTVDSKAYLKLEAARQKDKTAQRKAAKEAAAVGREICLLCFKALDLTPFLVAKGNPYLISDIEVALELLFAAFKASSVMVRINQ